ncbi:MAG: hypothetical protein M1484_01830 [Patescibacteria group bacterium]|nr:hypothetical protein [Patescibacteria group bacterium]MCL5431820.1 hypothetical protein [Patescibacteria group bacterium]
MRKLLVITGPTATGKTKLGIELAQKYNGEILSADSRQVYKSLDIGTGKQTKYFQWGIDLVAPNAKFNVSDYVKYANKVLEDIWRRGKLPIVVGGTGLYIKALLEPFDTINVPIDKELRSKNYELRELQEKLQQTDPTKWAAMNESDRQNPRRLIRALEVAIASSKTGLHPVMDDTNSLIIGLTASREYLNRLIAKRIAARPAVGQEAARAVGQAATALAYRGKSEQAYAHRQMAYLKKFLPQTIWFDIGSKNWKDKLCPTIKNTLAI